MPLFHIKWNIRFSLKNHDAASGSLNQFLPSVMSGKDLSSYTALADFVTMVFVRVHCNTQLILVLLSVPPSS